MAESSESSGGEGDSSYHAFIDAFAGPFENESVKLQDKKNAQNPQGQGSLGNGPQIPSKSEEKLSGPRLSSPSFSNADRRSRCAADVVGFLTQAEQSVMRQLPKSFKGMNGLILPRLIEGPISSVTLPSRLNLLGRQSFRLLAALNPIRLGNAVVGFAHTLYTADENECCKNCSSSCRKLGIGCLRHVCNSKGVKSQLYLLPFIFSKSMARIAVFVRCLLLLLFILMILYVFSVEQFNVGKAWMIGTTLSLYTMYRLSQFRKAPDGVRVFLRSLGAPEIEEYMFSYSWKVEAENIRTLARAMTVAGVGVWIDVIKLCPGDEIRPVVRTTVARVQRVVVFLSQEYCDSPNCCVEFMEAVQHPERLIICILNEVDESIHSFVYSLCDLGAIVVEGLEPLMKQLDFELQDMNATEAIAWWKKQEISGAGVPMNMVPTGWTMNPCSLYGRIIVPPKSIEVGPVYLAGNCKSSGQAFRPPYLLLIALASLTASGVDLYLKWNGSTPRQAWDFIWLAAVGTCNIAPFFATRHLLETRRDLHMSLRPLLASRSFNGQGVKVKVVGEPGDPIHDNLISFLKLIGHYYEPSNESSSLNEFPLKHCTVYVMNSIEVRDQLFGGSQFNINFDKNSLFIWSKEGTDPFSKDIVGERLMRYLVLVAHWEKNHLAASLFSALSVRVVDILQDKQNFEV